MRRIGWPRSMALLLALMLLFAPTAAFAQESVEESIEEEVQADNAAQAINTTDGTSVFDIAFDVVTVFDGIVDQTNLALAYSNCTNCSTLAVAIQVVLVAGEATVVEPQNLALSINNECNTCEAFAAAYQFVIGVPPEFEFTDNGEDGLENIYETVMGLWAGVQDGSITYQDFLAQLDTQMKELWRILKEEIVSDDDDDDDEGDDDEDEDDDEIEDDMDEDVQEASPSPSASATPSTEPSAGSGSTSSGGSGEPTPEAGSGSPSP